MDRDLLKEKIDANLREKNFYLTQFLNADALDADQIFDRYREMAKILRPFICNTSLAVNQAVKEGKKILFEGAQGTHLDIDHGTYPFVTSSNPLAGSACAGVGIGPDKLHHIIGIVKAYTTRVGSGPFVTELLDETGDYIQEKGSEFGATTGRRRRCGWLDFVMIRDSVRLNGLTSLSITKLDVLTGLDTLKICVAYEVDGKRIEVPPASLKQLAQCRPVFEDLPGWKDEIASAKTLNQLPDETVNYLKVIEEKTGVPISILSVGPMRDQTIEIKDPFSK